jgi:hypothetical protein
MRRPTPMGGFWAKLRQTVNNKGDYEQVETDVFVVGFTSGNPPLAPTAVFIMRDGQLNWGSIQALRIVPPTAYEAKYDPE